MYLANLKIGQRLGAGFGVVLLLMAGLTVIAWLRFGSVGEHNNTMIAEDWVKAEAANSVNALTRANARRTMELLIAPDQAYRAKVNAHIEANKEAINRELATLDALVHAPEAKALLAEIKEERAAYVAAFEKVRKLVAEENLSAASNIMVAETLPTLDSLQDSIKRLVDFQAKLVKASGASVQQDIYFARNFMLWVGIGAVLAGLWFAYRITRSITVPLGRAVKITQTVAGGDLTSTIEVTSKDETGQLLQALSDMNGSLHQIVGQVRAGTDAIATASGQIASGNLDLSARTEQQASSLEETASSMEELTSTVKQNGDSARQANQLALSAQEVAIKGGQVVEQVVGTMASINESSRKIVDIIGVIDGIAFQTNILALNAAVEAARAGEQGRGFAVVASEVRNLAQRSAGAAKEIKALIGDSVEKIGSGSKLVGQAGSTMDEIVASVRRVTDIMGEISLASREQESGIEQINQAVTEMDNVTQQNAALVEEAAAASGALQDQAAQLAGLVSVFKLRAGNSVAPAPAAKVQLASKSIVAFVPSAPKSPPRKTVNGADRPDDAWEEF
jgi:methyl-accepting chemotaxis protein